MSTLLVADALSTQPLIGLPTTTKDMPHFTVIVVCFSIASQHIGHCTVYYIMNYSATFRARSVSACSLKVNR